MCWRQSIRPNCWRPWANELDSALTIGELLHRDAVRLRAALQLDVRTSAMEARLLLAAACGVEPVWLLAHDRDLPHSGQLATYLATLERRLSGAPMAYILGEREFFGLMLRVTPEVLIPRPDTELLVELALARLPQRGGCRVIDLGTGSGAVALALAHTRPDADVLGVDRSEAALAVAADNARRLGMNNVTLLCSDWWQSVPAGRFELVVSNPPYIAAGDRHLGQGDVRFEPLQALVGGRDGLDDLRRIVPDACMRLTPGGWLLLEHGWDQAAAVRSLMAAAGLKQIESCADLGGNERVTLGQAG